jgi:hypothetical protein
VADRLDDGPAGRELDTVLRGDKPDEPPVVIDHRDGVGAGSQHGPGDRRQSVPAARLRPDRPIQQLTNRQLVGLLAPDARRCIPP